MSISEYSIRHSTTIIVLIVILVVAGSYAYVQLPRESFPDITIPNIVVTSVYEGVAPSDMENLVTRKIEQKIASIGEIEEIRSYSSEGMSTIVIEFMSGINIDTALQKVRDKVDEARGDLPEEMDEPTVDEINLAEFPIMTVVISGPVGLVRLKDIADDLSEDFESIQGVLEAPVYGGLEREIQVEFIPERLAAYNLSVTQVMNAVMANNQNTPGGKLDIGIGNYIVKVPGEFTDPEQARGLIVFNDDNNHPIYITDVARLRDSYKEQETKARYNQHDAITINIVKRSGENIIRITDDVKQIIEEYQKAMPQGITISWVNDMSEDIRSMVSELENNILSGMVLVLLVVLVGMGPRNALLVATAIPFSMLISFFVIQLMGLTLNMIVLFSLVLAVGMLVDNAIVIIENIYRHHSEGKGRIQAAIDATHEVFWPVVSSTATTVAAFFPMVFWPGMMGEFMAYLPLTVIITLCASLFVALVINPTLGSLWIRVKPHRERTGPPNIIIRGYRSLLGFSVDYPFFILGSAVCMFIVVLTAYGKFGHGVEFFPPVEPKRAFIDVKLPRGTNLEETDSFIKPIEEIVASYNEVKGIITNVGTAGSGIDAFMGGSNISPDIGRIVIEFVDIQEREIPSSQIIQEIRRKVKPFYQADIEVQEEENGPPTGAAVSIEISGEEYVVLDDIRRKIVEKIEGIPGLVELKDDYVIAKPEIVVNVDKQRAALFNLNTAIIAQHVKAAIRGIEAGVYREGNDEYDIVVRLPEERRQDLFSLKNLVISDPEGNHIPISSVAEITVSAGLGTIVRSDQKKVITIQGDAEGRLASEILLDVQAALANLELPRGYNIRYRGETEEQDESQEFLMEAFIGALMLIALILVTEFNSLFQPFIVMTSVILSTMGVLMGLLITGDPFGVIMTGIGVISLAGIVVNNVIVLLDYNNQLRQRGYSKRDSLIETGVLRFRPVILTAVTTILGLIPMALGISFDFRSGGWQVNGESAQWWGPMANAVIFGLTVATLMTLVVVPAIVSVGDKTSWGVQKLREKLKWKRAARTQLEPEV